MLPTWLCHQREVAVLSFRHQEAAGDQPISAVDFSASKDGGVGLSRPALFKAVPIVRCGWSQVPRKRRPSFMLDEGFFFFFWPQHKKETEAEASQS